MEPPPAPGGAPAAAAAPACAPAVSSEDSTDGQPEVLSVTVTTLAGRVLCFAGQRQDSPLAALEGRVAQELDLAEGEVLLLCRGAQVLAPSESGKSLKELGLGAEVGLTCVRRLALRPGERVLVDGLTCAGELNGARGVCEEWLADRGRWRVCIDVSRDLPEASLEPTIPGQLVAYGCPVRLVPSEAAAVPELAGAAGRCEGWHGGLMRVSLTTTRNVRPRNLFPMPSDVPPELAAMMLLPADAEVEERDAQPAAGLEAALGGAFTTGGRPSWSSGSAGYGAAAPAPPPAAAAARRPPAGAAPVPPLALDDAAPGRGFADADGGAEAEDVELCATTRARTQQLGSRL